MGIEAGSSTYYQAKRGIVQDGLMLHLDAGVKESYSGGTTWRDISGNGYNGVFYNGPTFSRSGKKPTISFDGSNDHIQVASPSSRFAWTPSGDGMNYMTIDFWINTTDGSFILTKPWNGNGWYNFWIKPSSIYLVCSTVYQKNFTSIATGEWKNLVCVVTPTQVGAYINSSLDSSFSNHSITTNAPGNGVNNNIPLSLMTLYPYGSGMGDIPGHAQFGNLGCLRIYNRQLSASEISQNYNATRHRFGL